MKTEIKSLYFDSAKKDQSSGRLDVNDLLKKREEEKQIDKKNNIIIVSGLVAVIGVAVIIVSL